MLKLSLKIWAVANLVVFLLFAISLFPTGFNKGFTAVLFSSLFSLPAILIIYLLLLLLQNLRERVVFNWVLLLVVTGLTAYTSCFLFRFWFGDLSEPGFILPLGLVSGYAAVLFAAPKLNYLFEKFQYENETECY